MEGRGRGTGALDAGGGLHTSASAPGSGSGPGRWAQALRAGGLDAHLDDADAQGTDALHAHPIGPSRHAGPRTDDEAEDGATEALVRARIAAARAEQDSPLPPAQGTEGAEDIGDGPVHCDAAGALRHPSSIKATGTASSDGSSGGGVTGVLGGIARDIRDMAHDADAGTNVTALAQAADEDEDGEID